MAISSEVGLYNLALNAVGSRDNISSPTENSREAEVCQLWYTTVRDQILAAAPWPEATKVRSLSLLAEATGAEWAFGDPKPGYSYVYGAPSDMLRPQYLTDFSRFNLANYGGNQQAINTNAAPALLAYTFRLENISLWGAELQMAVVYGLAAHICMPLTGKPSRGRVLAQEANNRIWAARESAANASDERYDSVPDWISARGYSDATSARYVYPFTNTLSLPNVN